jgi:hypothetical protein
MSVTKAYKVYGKDGRRHGHSFDESYLKTYKIIYYIRPDSEDVEVVIKANSYEDACIFAKQFRSDSFSVIEVKGD